MFTPKKDDFHSLFFCPKNHALKLNRTFAARQIPAIYDKKTCHFTVRWHRSLLLAGKPGTEGGGVNTTLAHHGLGFPPPKAAIWSLTTLLINKWLHSDPCWRTCTPTQTHARYHGVRMSVWWCFQVRWMSLGMQRHGFLCTQGHPGCQRDGFL